MRISDWSSDVCSSDLNKILQHKQLRNALSRANSLDVRLRSPFSTCAVSGRIAHWRHCLPDSPMPHDLDQVAASPSSKDSLSVNTSGTDLPRLRKQIGSDSSRERLFTYV